MNDPEWRDIITRWGDEPLGGDSACWAHMLDEDGRVIEVDDRVPTGAHPPREDAEAQDPPGSPPSAHARPGT